MRKTVILLAAALVAPAAFAQPAPPPIVPVAQGLDPAALAAARALLEATDFDAQVERSAQLSSQAAFGTMLRTMEQQQQIDFPADLEAELRTILADHMDGFVAELRRTALEDAARVYARYFTAQEIAELQRLQTHPVMVKFQRIAPEVMTELGQIGLAVEAPRMAELDRRMRAAVEGWLARSAELGDAPQS